MRLGIAWTVASKDFSTYRTRRTIVVSLLVVPCALAIGLPALLELQLRRGTPGAVLSRLPDAFTFLFVMFASFLPASLASYSIVGEKLQKSLEPLLATPTTDEELLLGKLLGAFVPSVVAMLGAEVLYSALVDLLLGPNLGRVPFPSASWTLLTLLGVPLAALLGTSANLLISSRATDVRTAQTLGALAMLPLAAVYLSFELGALAYDTPTLLVLCAGLAVADVLLLVLDRAAFRRDEILTTWA